MQNAQQRLISFPPPPAVHDAIEWEELPSLAGVAARSDVRHGAPAWSVTMPAQLADAISESTPFREPMRGLVMREVNEPELFRHFFG
jgi:hypothetical protein